MHYIDQVGFKFTRIQLPMLFKYWDQRHVPPHLPRYNYFYTKKKPPARPGSAYNLGTWEIEEGSLYYYLAAHLK